jgi:hypothetical protein
VNTIIESLNFGKNQKKMMNPKQDNDIQTHGGVERNERAVNNQMPAMLAIRFTE